MKGTDILGEATHRADIIKQVNVNLPIDDYLLLRKEAADLKIPMSVLLRTYLDQPLHKLRSR